MNLLNSARRFIPFAAIGFGPLILAYGILIFGLLLNVAISISDASFMDSLQFILYSVLLIAFLSLSLFASFSVFKRMDQWLVKGFILYASWLIISIVPAFLLIISLAGVSMAAVDGGLTQRALLATTFEGLFPLLLIAQIMIIPWVWGATWVMRKLEPDRSAPS